MSDSAASFQSLGIGKPLRATLADLGLKKPTAVQIACIPPTLAGRNVIGAAPTGTGKTAAYA
jgi:superfamily II DNA/RNA helicase